MEELRILQRQFEKAANDYRGLSHVLTAWKSEEREPDFTEAMVDFNQGTKIKTWHCKPSLDAYKADIIKSGVEEIQEEDLKRLWIYKHWLMRPNHHNWNEKVAFDCFKVLVRKARGFLSLLSQSPKCKNEYREITDKTYMLEQYYYDKENDCEDEFSEWIFFLYKFSSNIEYRVPHFDGCINYICIAGGFESTKVENGLHMFHQSMMFSSNLLYSVSGFVIVVCQIVA